MIKRYIFDEKLININKKVISSKKDMWRYKREVQLISKKRLKKGWMDKYSILNVTKYFGENGWQNYLVFQQISTNFFMDI